MRWTDEEELCCCIKYVEYYVVKKLKVNSGVVIEEIKCLFPERSTGSIRRKLQNIKQILLENNIEETCALKPLTNYSQNNKNVLRAVLKGAGIYIH